MAAALIVPAAGVVATQSAGAAATPDNVTCTTNTGTLKFNPGVSLTARHGQFVTNVGNTTFTGANTPRRGTPGTLDGCTGIGITDSTGGSLYFGIQRAAVNCKSIVANHNVFIGHAAVVWNSDGSNAGIITKMQLSIRFNSFTQIQFSGSVTSTYLHGGKIRGTATVPPNLRSSGDNGGTCGNSKAGRVKTLDCSNKSDFTINVPPAS